MTKMKRLLMMMACGWVLAAPLAGQADNPGVTIERSAAPDDARVYFISPADGDVISGPVTVRFGLQGIGVAPAGVNAQNTGHHHLLINVDTLPDMGLPLPASDQVRHFGGGQTQTTISLEPGTHTLQLVLGDYRHIPHQPAVMSEAITITVTD